MKLLALSLLGLDIALVPVFRWYIRQQRELAWTVGHKLGRVSGMIGKEQADKMLTEMGIDPTMLPPR